MNKGYVWALLVLVVFFSGFSDNHLNYQGSKEDLSDPALNLNEMDWSVRSQSEVPAERIAELDPAIIKIDEISDRSYITAPQWAFGSNLNLAEDLSSYPSAREAVSQKHASIITELESGHVTYTDGVISNGERWKIDLNDEHLYNTIISALPDGGFKIAKSASSGRFTIEDYTIDLGSGPLVNVILQSDGDIQLSKDAQMKTSEGYTIFALSDLTIITRTADGLSVDGIAIVKIANQKLIVGDLKSSAFGKFTVAADGPEKTIRIRDAHRVAIFDDEAKVELGEGSAFWGGDILVLDDPLQERLTLSLTEALWEQSEVCNSPTGCPAGTGMPLEEMIRATLGYDPVHYNEKYGIPYGASASASAAALLTAGDIAPPTFVFYENEFGQYHAALGFDGQTLRPYLTAGLYDNQLRLEGTGGGVRMSLKFVADKQGSVSTYAVLSPRSPGSFSGFGAQVVAGDQIVRVESGGSDDGEVSFSTRRGPAEFSVTASARPAGVSEGADLAQLNLIPSDRMDERISALTEQRVMVGVDLGSLLNGGQ